MIVASLGTWSRTRTTSRGVKRIDVAIEPTHADTIRFCKVDESRDVDGYNGG